MGICVVEIIGKPNEREKDLVVVGANLRDPRSTGMRKWHSKPNQNQRRCFY